MLDKLIDEDKLHENSLNEGPLFESSQLIAAPTIYECMWNGCDFQSEEINDCLDHCIAENSGHVQSHFRGMDPTNTEYQCHWKGCNLDKKIQSFPTLVSLSKHVCNEHINKGNGSIINLEHCKNKEEFLREYKRSIYAKGTAKKLYLQILTELDKSISEGNIDNFKKFSNFLDYLSDIEDHINLSGYYENSKNPFKNTNLVILVCKHNKVNILESLFGNDSNVLNNLSVVINRSTIIPQDEDEASHNAFYYAIRSGNVELLETLINKWPDNYFSDRLEELDEIVSIAYEELKLKKVLLSDEIEFFVENKLINLRFFSNTSEQGQNFKFDVNNIKERIELLLQSITLLKTEYSDAKKVDEKFLFISKCVAQHIHVLKRQLKSTYDRLPWEEMEFCLVTFVSCQSKQQEINLVYHAKLNKNKILMHLQNFAEKLEYETDNILGAYNNKLNDLPKLKREKVVAGIISKCPQFEDLYNDHQQVRDIYCLERINDYINLALATDPKEREGQLIITRVLQVIGEYLKNTLESPNLSNTTSGLFLLSLPKNTREVVIDLRNSLSHAYSLSKRTEIEENTNIDFFIGVQNDTKKVGDVISDILYNNKIKMVRTLLQKIISSENEDELKEVATVLSNAKVDKMIDPGKFTKMEHEKLEDLIKKLSDNITDKTDYEQELINKINNIVNSAKTEPENIKTNYTTGFLLLQSLSFILNENMMDQNYIRGIKFYANKTLEYLVPQIKIHSLKEIASLVMKISQSVKRIQHGNTNEVDRLISEIFYLTAYETDDIKWIEALREKLNENGSFIPTYKQRRVNNVTEEMQNNQLAVKLSELKNILNNNGLSDQLMEKFPAYKKNKKLQVIIEMLLLDIMSILGTSKNCLENNLLFLDDNAPLLTGKCLRNHLAHDNALVDVLLSDPSVAVILNAKKLTQQNFKRNKKIGKLVKDDPSKLKEKYEQGLIIITNQEKMFVALEDGNLEEVKRCLNKGVDINARSTNLWTTLHFAAKGPSLEVVKFIIDQNVDAIVKDVNGLNPLHVAAANGRRDIVEFFVKKASLDINEPDNDARTPLHHASQNGHKTTVETLLKNKANSNARDKANYAPLHYAVKNNHIDVVKVLLNKEVDVDINEAAGGFTPLHLAADSGHLEILQLLLKHDANVNTRSDKEGTPLHIASLNGHLEVVKALISNGSDVNARILDGCTPLHYAIENNHEKIANILLKSGANVNVFEKVYWNTPLHYAANNGNKEIVMNLLKYKANVDVTTVNGCTPLHVAAQFNHVEIITALLKHGANIHAKNKNHCTPLHAAANSGHKEAVELLIKYKAKINAKSLIHFTPLHSAAMEGHKDVTDILIKSKADVNVRDIQGNSPLFVASSHGNKDVIELLIENKADVNAKANDGLTPLQIAAANGHEDAVILLIEKKAEVNSRALLGLTPLHAAVAGGYKNIVRVLIKNKAQVNAKAIANSTPLHLAVEAGHVEIVQTLIANGAGVNIKNDYNQTPLTSAVKLNFKEITEILVANGARVNEKGNEPLLAAVMAGYKDIIDILLKNKACINMKGTANATALHVAAERGFKDIVNTLIANGADVNALAMNNVTPLYLAAAEGNAEIVKILTANGANINIKAKENLTALHIAANHGHSNVVELLMNEKNVHTRDVQNRTPLYLAVEENHFDVVKMILKFKKIDLNANINRDWTVLHIAAQRNNIEMIKYLINEGSDMNAQNTSGSKPIHIAAREGQIETVEFFLNNGFTINEPGAANQTLLHYASINGNLKLIEYLIKLGADVNAQDDNGLTSIHIAANFGYKNVIELLLKHGAICHIVDIFDTKPIERANDEDIIILLASTEKLFEAVKRKNCTEIENCIELGAIVDAKHADNATSLHYAAWKGYEEIVNILLKNNANPNVIGNKGVTPLHYAAKFSHLKIVKTLLSNGAIYNAVCDNGKTPLDFTKDKNIINLFKLLSESFKNILKGNSKVINDLSKINEADTIKAIMGARNKNNRTLIVAAVHSNFPNIKQLKQISQGNISEQVDVALLLLAQGDYQRGLSILTNAYEKRKEVLGPDNPGTLDIQTHIAVALYKKGAYQDAINLLEEILQKQTRILGVNDKDTLNTRSTMALVLHRQGKDEEAFDIFQEVYEKQKEILGPNHRHIVNTQFHMAAVLDRQGKYEEALKINREVYENSKRVVGKNDPLTISVLNNIGIVLSNQGKYDEALKINRKVVEKKTLTLGLYHTDTLRTLYNISSILFSQKKYNEGIKAARDVLLMQKKALGHDNPETLNTQYNLANMLFSQGKWVGALKAYRECLEKRKAIFGSNHDSVVDILKKIEIINLRFKFESNNESEILLHLQRDITIAASKGDTKTILRLLKDGADVNDTDIEGRTPLHYAVSNKHVDLVKILLENEADVTQATNKGNTSLHTATSEKSKEIVEILLSHVSRDKLNDFINAKTTVGGTTSLHVAAKNGSLEIVNSLLKHGATYNIKNKEGKTPYELSKDSKVTNILKLIDELFRETKKGNVDIMKKLRTIQPDQRVAIIHARNIQENTLLQVAIANKHKNIVSNLLQMIKESDNLNLKA